MAYTDPHQNRRFTFVDGLRGLAALSVVFYHASEGGHIPTLMTVMTGWAAAAMKHSNQGVAVFFALSGFVIAHTVYAYRVNASFVGRFMLRRAVRLDPPYWFAIALALGLAALSAVVIPGKDMPDISSGQLIAHIFYIQEMVGYPHINAIFWTLCLEVQFYLVHVVLLAASRNDPGKPLQGRCTAIVLATSALFSLLWPTGLVVANIWPGFFLPLWHSFLVGVGAYWAWRNPKIMPFFLGFVAIIVGAALLRGSAFSFVSAITAIAMWCVAVSGRITTAFNWRALQFLGAISYSLYLTHNPITGASFRVGYILTGHSNFWEAFWWLVSMAACVAFAAAVWWLVERPSIRWARKISLRTKIDPQASIRCA